MQRELEVQRSQCMKMENALAGVSDLLPPSLTLTHSLLFRSSKHCNHTRILLKEEELEERVSLQRENWNIRLLN